jgi:hypothetical protein
MLTSWQCHGQSNHRVSFAAFCKTGVMCSLFRRRLMPSSDNTSKKLHDVFSKPTRGIVELIDLGDTCFQNL